MVQLTVEQGIKLLDLFSRKMDEFAEEAIAELRRTDAPGQIGSPRAVPATGDMLGSATPIPEADATATRSPSGDTLDAAVASSIDRSSSWSLDEQPQRGGWDEMDMLADQTFKWADGNVDHYDRLVRYRGTGDFAGLILGLGYLPNGDVVGFFFGTGGGSRRGITYWFPTDDFAKSRERVSAIRGAGRSGKAFFAPTDALPTAYSGLATDILKTRVAGKWNVQAVVAEDGDHNVMLAHTALQAKLRKLA